MLRIEISNLELCKDILEIYTNREVNEFTTQEIVERICENMDIQISEDYSYISDLLTYLLDKTTIVLDTKQVELLIIIKQYRYILIIQKDLDKIRFLEI